MNKNIKDNWLIIISGLYNTYVEFSNCLLNIFNKLGYNTDLKFISPNETVIDGENKNIIFIKGKQNNSDIKFKNCKYKIFYQLEQYHKDKYFRNLLSQVDCTLHLFRNYYDLDETSKKKILCSIGYDESFETNLISNKNIIDVFHFGSITRYRKNWLKRNNIPIFKKIYGYERNELILNSKVNLILKAQIEYSLPQIHTALILSKKMFIACDEMIDYYPFEPNKHFVIIKNIKDLKYWLENDKERIDFGINAYNEFKKIKMIDHVENVINNL